MLPEHQTILNELKIEVSKQKTERDCEWLDDIPAYINFWHFLENLSLKEQQRFFTLLDVENSAESGWGRFCEALGLKFWADQKWCQLYQDGKGPTRTALTRLKENEDHDKDLSLLGVLEIIREINRPDILQQINWKGLADEYILAQQKKDMSSLKSSCKESIINVRQPHSMPLVQSENLGQRISNAETCITRIPPRKRMTKHQPWVLMTHASDARDIALKVSQQLRQGTKNRPKIGVLLLSDPMVRRNILTDPNASLYKWFHEAWYVIPILSPEYLRQIHIVNEDGDNEEALHNRFIYRLTLDQYCSLGSLNHRCRAICSDSYRLEVRNSNMVQGMGLFSPSWNTSPQEIEELSTFLLDRPRLSNF